MPPDPPSFQGFLLFVTGTPDCIATQVRQLLITQVLGKITLYCYTGEVIAYYTGVR